MAEINDFTKYGKGLVSWENDNGYTTLLLHFSADQEGKTEEERRQGVTEGDFRREHDLDFTSLAGKAVFPEFGPEHLTDKLFYVNDIPVWRGWDFGYHRPAVVYSQLLGDGQWWIIGEILGQDMSLPQFIENVVFPYEEKNFPNAVFLDSADIAGRQVTDKSEHSSFTILNRYGIYPIAKKTEIKEGLTLIRQKLADTKLGNPGLFIKQSECPILVEAFSGGYHFEPPRPGRAELEIPAKDGYYDHIVDAVRYIAVNNFHLWVAKPKVIVEKSWVEKFLDSKKNVESSWDM